MTLLNDIITEAKNQLRKFERITFYEEPHIYTYREDDGSETQIGISVTTLVGKYEQPFDENDMAQKYAKKHKKSKEEVLKKWHFDRDFSCCKGTHTHAYNEYLWRFNGAKLYDYDKDAVINEFGSDIVAPVWERLKSICTKFYEEFKDRIIPVGLEQIVASKYYDISGAIDFLAYSCKLKEFIIIDYKTNKEIKKEAFNNQTMLAPLTYIPDCNYYYYSLQLAIYKYLLEYETTLKISSRKWLVWMNEKNDDYIIYECANLDNEAQIILEERRRELCPF